MFLLFGLGKQTVKKLGKIREQVCEHCQKPSERVLIKVVDWFTLFFIPIFPYLTRYALVCPLCDEAREVSRDEAGELIAELKPLEPGDVMDSSKYGDTDRETGEWLFGAGAKERDQADSARPGRYQGKNATQIAYLAKLEERDRELAAQREKEELDKDAEEAAQRIRTARRARAAQKPSSHSEGTDQDEAAVAQSQTDADAEQSQAGEETRDRATARDTADAMSSRENEAARSGQSDTARNERSGQNEAARSGQSEAQDRAVARERALAAREMALEAREKAAEVREKAVEAGEAPTAVKTGEASSAVKTGEAPTAVKQEEADEAPSL